MIRILLILPVVVLLAGCQEERADASLTTGQVLYLPPPDNCNGYVISVAEKLYYPTNLSKEFQQDNLLVEVSFGTTDSTHDCGFGGAIPVIEVLTIKKQQ